MLERGNEQGLVEGTVGKRQIADVRLDGLHPVNVGRREIDAHELDTRAQERTEVRRLREGVADLEHPPGRTKA